MAEEVKLFKPRSNVSAIQELAIKADGDLAIKNSSGVEKNLAYQEDITFVYNTADLTCLNSTTMAYATGFTFAVEAAEVYKLKGDLLVFNDYSTTLNFAAYLNVPSGTTVKGHLDDTWSADFLDLSTTQTAAVDGDTYKHVSINAIVDTAATAGNVRLYFAQGTAQNDAMKIKANSVMQLMRLRSV